MVEEIDDQVPTLKSHGQNSGDNGPYKKNKGKEPFA